MADNYPEGEAPEEKPAPVDDEESTACPGDAKNPAPDDDNNTQNPSDILMSPPEDFVKNPNKPGVGESMMIMVNFMKMAF